MWEIQSCCTFVLWKYSNVEKPVGWLVVEPRVGRPIHCFALEMLADELFRRAWRWPERESSVY